MNNSLIGLLERVIMFSKAYATANWGGDWSSILVKSSAVRELCLTLKKTSVYP